MSLRNIRNILEYHGRLDSETTVIVSGFIVSVYYYKGRRKRGQPVRTKDFTEEGFIDGRVFRNKVQDERFLEFDSVN